LSQSQTNCIELRESETYVVMPETVSCGFPQDWVIISGEPYVLLQYTANIITNYDTMAAQQSDVNIKSNQIRADVKFYSTDIDIDIVTEINSDITMLISGFGIYRFTDPIIKDYSFSDNNSNIVNISVVALNRMVEKS